MIVAALEFFAAGILFYLAIGLRLAIGIWVEWRGWRSLLKDVILLPFCYILTAVAMARGAKEKS
ncbi:MAG: hypothetical protein PHW95_04630 [Patescibacteria group bacterium]|nr:hypothetical protein [Patescibacteria group bacterium]